MLSTQEKRNLKEGDIVYWVDVEVPSHNAAGIITKTSSDGVNIAWDDDLEGTFPFNDKQVWSNVWLAP